MPKFRSLRDYFFSKQEAVEYKHPSKHNVPHACHIDPFTILNKNGEILQIIRIEGFASEQRDTPMQHLRETIRKALLDIASDHIAIYFHTIRKRQNLDSPTHHNGLVSKHIHDEWCRKNYWRDKYVNELYITVLYESKSANMDSWKDFLNSFSFEYQTTTHDNYIQNIHPLLTKATDHLLSALTDYGAQRLAIIETPNGMVSEPLQFFSKILHLSEQPLLLPMADLSAVLCQHKMALGNDTIEIRIDKEKYFAAFLSLKEYIDLPSNYLDRFLQLPIEFIVSQSLHFLPASEVYKKYKYQHYILKDVSRDLEFAHLSGLDRIMNSDQKRLNDFGQSQISIMISASSLNELEEDIKRAVEALQQLGLLVVREDMFLEHMYWAQLPGNFTFLRRNNPMETSRMAGFASLHNFPAGLRFTSHWQEPLTLFRTYAGTPYFFNLHDGDNGHSLLIGSTTDDDTATMLRHFLLSAMHKPNHTILMLDTTKQSHTIIKALGGSYYQTTVQSEIGVRLNPLLLADHPDHRAFLADWLRLLMFKADETIHEQEQALIEDLISYNYSLPLEQRQLRYLAHHIEQTSLAQRLKPWHSGGIYTNLFDNHFDALELYDENPVLGIYLGELLNQSADILSPLLAYYLYRFDLMLEDALPSMLIIHDASKLFCNRLFLEAIPYILERFRQRNVAVIFSTQSLDTLKSAGPFYNNIKNHIACMMITPDPEKNRQEYADFLHLNDEQTRLIARMKTTHRHFFIKNSRDSLVAELNLAGLESVITLLRGDIKTQEYAQSLMIQHGDHPDQWVPLLWE